MGARPTRRGWALLAAGLVGLWLGVGLGSTDVVRVALLVLAVVVAGFGQALTWRPGRGRRAVEVLRTVSPSPVHAGETAQVRVQVVGPDADRVTLAEQAAVQLAGSGDLRARTTRAAGRTELAYAIRPAVRGRWSLGPLVATRADVFGVAQARTHLGAGTVVPVWPAVTALAAPGDVLLGEPDRVALGVRSPSPDDAALREYREGDDLRRVHWTSTARRGRVMVRADEHTGMRPVSVLVELATTAAELEWTLSAAASMALAMLTAGHPVRLLGLGEGEAEHVHQRSGVAARAALLDATVDVRLPVGPEAAAQRLERALHMVGRHTGEIVLAVLGPGEHSAAPLAVLADGAQCWAMVRVAAGDREPRTSARTRSLLRTGWHAIDVGPGEPVDGCWLRLLGGAR